MIRLDKITTRGGDGGETSLGDGTRVRKDTPRLEAMGAVDEANAALGMVLARIGDHPVRPVLLRMQNDLFNLGADLCMPDRPHPSLKPDDCAALEADIRRLNKDLAPLRSFVLPSGPEGVAEAHLARTVLRRAERRVVALIDAHCAVPVKYLNRASDLLFVMGRVLAGGRENLWVPAAAG